MSAYTPYMIYNIVTPGGARPPSVNIGGASGPPGPPLSYSTAIIVGIGTKSYGFRKFYTLKINLAIGFIRKNQLECIGKAVMMLYLG